MVGNLHTIVESHAQRSDRLAREARMLAEARAQIDAGLGIESEAVDAWIDSLDTPGELPPPYPDGFR